MLLFGPYLPLICSSVFGGLLGRTSVIFLRSLIYSLVSYFVDRSYSSGF